MADSVAWVRPMRVFPAPVSAAVYLHSMCMLGIIVNVILTKSKFLINFVDGGRRAENCKDPGVDDPEGTERS